MGQNPRWEREGWPPRSDPSLPYIVCTRDLGAYWVGNPEHANGSTARSRGNSITRLKFRYWIPLSTSTFQHLGSFFVAQHASPYNEICLFSGKNTVEALHSLILSAPCCRETAPRSLSPRSLASRRTIKLFLPHLLLPRKSNAFTPKPARPLRLITMPPTHPFFKGVRLLKGKLEDYVVVHTLHRREEGK